MCDAIRRTIDEENYLLIERRIIFDIKKKMQIINAPKTQNTLIQDNVWTRVVDMI